MKVVRSGSTAMPMPVVQTGSGAYRESITCIENPEISPAAPSRFINGARGISSNPTTTPPSSSRGIWFMRYCPSGATPVLSKTADSPSTYGSVKNRDLLAVVDTDDHDGVRNEPAVVALVFSH